jgi:hypothetical protein
LKRGGDAEGQGKLQGIHFWMGMCVDQSRQQGTAFRINNLRARRSRASDVYNLFSLYYDCSFIENTLPVENFVLPAIPIMWESSAEESRHTAFAERMSMLAKNDALSVQ